MPAFDSPAVVVARFLKANHYDDTLDAFIKEAGLPADAGSTTRRGDLTLEKILEEKKAFDLTANFEKLNTEDQHDRWSIPAPSHATQVSTLPTSANLLHVSVEALTSTVSPERSHVLLATTADRRLNVVAANSTLDLIRSHSHLQDSPILSCVTLGKSFVITASMSGQLVLYDHVRDIVREERRDHKKYIVKVASQEDSRGAWIATAGWDAKVLLYRLEKDEGGDYRLLGSPVAFLNLQSIPETALFINHPSADGSILLVTRRDSTFLFYFSLPPLNQQIGSPPSEPVEMRLLGKQNLAPHSNAWITFSPSSVAVCPTDSTLVAIGTSAVPHMKLLIVRLLVPPLRAQEETSSMPTTQAAQARADLAIQDKEDAAIEIHMSTLAPQTPYSTPQVCWRPNGTGVWTNGDDGTLRGIEARTGKIVSTLKGGHKVGSKIRSIWAGNVDIGGKQEEWVVSGGFDQRLVVWKGFEEGSISHERA